MKYQQSFYETFSSFLYFIIRGSGLAVRQLKKGLFLKTDSHQERQWIEDAKKDPDAFRYLFDKYYSTIFNYVRRRTGSNRYAKDITSNVFLKALTHIDSFTWKGVPFSSWLYRIATNEINQNYRKIKKTIYLAPEVLSGFASEIASDRKVLDSEEFQNSQFRNKKIHQAIASLKPKYQTVLTLRYFENKKFREIAEILNLSENTVKTLNRRGIIQLKKAYEKST